MSDPLSYTYHRIVDSFVQVEILQLENALAQARTRLGEMRKLSYLEE